MNSDLNKVFDYVQENDIKSGPIISLYNVLMSLYDDLNI